MGALTAANKRSFAVRGCVLLLVGGACAHAQTPAAREFSIAPQALSAALEQFASQSGREILFAPEVAANRQSGGVHGDMDAQAALHILLRGTDLEFKITPGGAILIGRPGTLLAEGDAPSDRSRTAGYESLWSRFWRSVTRHAAAPVDAANGSAVSGAAKPGASCGVVAAAGSDCAQQAAIDQRHTFIDSGSDALREVIVTANRQEQDAQKVSAALQVIGGASLSDEALVNVEQIFANVPSIQVTGQPAGFNLDVRGQAADLPAASGQGSVALEFDGVYNILSQATTGGFFDVDRIEVLPGPQSTQYGPNAKGGVVNVVSRDPVLGSTAGSAALTAGSFGLLRAEFAQDIPVSDVLALRVAATATRRDSYFTPASGNASVQSARLKLLFQPTARLTMKGEVQVDHFGGTGNGSEAGQPFFAAFVDPYSRDSINQYSNPWAHGDYSTSGDQPSMTSTNIDQFTFIGSVGYRFNDWAALDVTPSYIKQSGSQYDCYPPEFARVGGVHTCAHDYPVSPFYSYATEARLHSVGGDPVLWNLGLYHWNYEDAAWSGRVPSGEVAGPQNAALSATMTNALFGDVTYPILKRLRLIAGLRQSWDERKLRPGDGNQNIYTHRYQNFDYRAGEEFDVAANSMQYFAVSTGYAPGGINYSGALNAAQTSPNETLTSLELGSKNRFFDDHMQINGDVFWYIQRNYPFRNSYTNFVLPDGTVCSADQNPMPLECRVPNAIANAHTLGVELQLQFNVTTHDQLSANATYLHARYDEHQHACNTQGLPSSLGAGCWLGYNLNGGDPNSSIEWFNTAGGLQDHAPAFASVISYRHSFHFASGASVRVGGSGFYSSGYWLMPIPDIYYDFWQPAYWQGNVDAAFMPAQGHWMLDAYVRNVGNYAVKVSGQPATSISDPRTYGATLSFKW